MTIVGMLLLVYLLLGNGYLCLFLNKTYTMRYLCFALVFTFLACDKNKPTEDGKDLDPISDTTTVKGYQILTDFVGIWNGSVTSTTPLGGYPEWIVDFRPVSAAQLSGKAELDTLNDIFMGFFIAQYDGEYLMAFRNGGGFAGLQRVSYARCDSTYNNSTERYYRFVDFKAGMDRVFVEFRFKNDSVYMQTFTNKYNSLSAPTLHMQWNAKRVDNSAANDAVQHFGFPKKEVVKDFSDSFEGVSEAVFYGSQTDPYPQSEHPYLGDASFSCSFGSAVQVQAGAQVIVVISTQPLFSGVQYLPANLKYRSRYVLLTGDNPSSYAFDYVHPGSYYLNVFYDTNADLVPQSGEFIQYPFDQPFTLGPNSTIDLQSTINTVIP